VICQLSFRREIENGTTGRVAQLNGCLFGMCSERRPSYAVEVDRIYQQVGARSMIQKAAQGRFLKLHQSEMVTIAKDVELHA
jgi:hypothetical protein